MYDIKFIRLENSLQYYCFIFIYSEEYCFFWGVEIGKMNHDLPLYLDTSPFSLDFAISLDDKGLVLHLRILYLAKIHWENNIRLSLLFNLIFILLSTVIIIIVII